MKHKMMIQTLLLCGVGIGSALAMPNQPVLTAGAGNAEIQFSATAFPGEGFVGVHDELHVRALLLDDGQRRVGILSVDQTSITEEATRRMKEILQNVAHVAPENSLVIASHTFSSPHVMPWLAHTAEEKQRMEDVNRSIESAVTSACEEAVKSIQPAGIGFGKGLSNVNINRDVETPRGWWMGANAAAYSDHSVNIVRVNRADGSPLSLLVNFAVQSSIMDHSVSSKGGQLVTGDLQGAAMRYVEKYYGNHLTSQFLIGAAGDQVPLLMANRYVQKPDGSTERQDLQDAGFTLVDMEGERLGSDVVSAADAIQASGSVDLEVVRSSFKVASQKKAQGLPGEPVKSYTFERDEAVDVPVVMLRMGEIVLVGLRGELSAELGAEIRNRSPFKNTFVVTLVDGGAKYMPNAISYDRFTYEARNSGYARGAAEEAVEHILTLLKDMQK